MHDALTDYPNKVTLCYVSREMFDLQMKRKMMMMTATTAKTMTMKNTKEIDVNMDLYMATTKFRYDGLFSYKMPFLELISYVSAIGLH